MGHQICMLHEVHLDTYVATFSKWQHDCAYVINFVIQPTSDIWYFYSHHVVYAV